MGTTTLTRRTFTAAKDRGQIEGLDWNVFEELDRQLPRTRHRQIHVLLEGL